MIEKEELVAALSELMDGDLSEGAIDYIASDLLEKFVLFKRPDVGVVTEEGGVLRVDGRSFPVYSKAQIDEWAEGNLKEAEFYVYKLMESRGLLEHYRKKTDEAKAKRREEVSSEMGYPLYMYAPQPIKTLIARLVDAEAANARN